MNAFLGVAIAESLKKKGAPQPVRMPVWCQDAAQTLQGGVYRADGAPDAYLLALSDAGRGIWVGPDQGLSILLPGDTAKAANPAAAASPAKLSLAPATPPTSACDRLPPP